MEYGFSCMGYEIAGALGAKMAAPDREVFALVGDGSYVMLHSELLTSVMEGVKINIVVFDNHGFQCIDNLQVSQGITKFGNDLRVRDPGTGRLTGAAVNVDCESWWRVGTAQVSANPRVEAAARRIRETAVDARQF
jgi:3D-(3,5/4)-trihydroxycyclohexane-1,2-dione acylhydrolase (decyclizing)